MEPEPYYANTLRVLRLMYAIGAFVLLLGMVFFTFGDEFLMTAFYGICGGLCLFEMLRCHEELKALLK